MALFHRQIPSEFRKRGSSTAKTRAHSTEANTNVECCGIPPSLTHGAHSGTEVSADQVARQSEHQNTCATSQDGKNEAMPTSSGAYAAPPAM